MNVKQLTEKACSAIGEANELATRYQHSFHDQSGSHLGDQKQLQTME